MVQTAAQLTQVDELESRVDQLLRDVDSTTERVTHRLSDEPPPPPEPKPA
ncbi:MAG: hypothetical protein H7Y88_13765, partial [Phycisphaerales bacterium]|nr:hypothetical protein [Phycisphaerales bacterium]